MKILIMGGTLFLGRAIVDDALAAGHDVTLFHRGRTNPGLYPDAEHLIGDRDGDLNELRGRSFDSVIDTSAYFPRQVRSVVDALEANVGHYTFVSSASVYASHETPGANESAELSTVDDPEIEELGPKYGGFKALCEAALDDVLPGRSHDVRAGLIVGPHDNTGRFSYWVRRIAAGGTVLAPEPKDQPVQLIDVRDLARWIIHAAESGVTGAMNASSTPGALTMAELLAAIYEETASDATLRWVGEQFLLDEGIRPWDQLPLWLPPASMPTHAGFMMRDTSLAQQHGLVTRPLRETIAATIDFLNTTATSVADKDFGNLLSEPGLKPAEEQALLEKWDL